MDADALPPEKHALQIAVFVSFTSVSGVDYKGLLGFL
jgi:hypothetical protein